MVIIPFKKRTLCRTFAGVFPLILSIIFAAFLAVGIIRFDNSLRQRQLAAVRQSVVRATTHCYSLEGAYPPNLDYLAKNYGLVIDKGHYIYDYRVFASNVPPEIQIFRKN